MAMEKRSITVSVGKAPETLESAEQVFLADCKARNLSPRTMATNQIILRGLREALGGKPLAEITSADRIPPASISTGNGGLKARIVDTGAFSHPDRSLSVLNMRLYII